MSEKPSDRDDTGGAAFLGGDGDMAGRIAAHDWSHSLGPIESWPQSLKTTVGLMIHSPVALVLLWGPDGIMIYNDAYGVFAGNRHPGLLGQNVLEGWPEAADLNSHVMAVCMAGGTLQYKDRELVLNRRGKPEAGWMDLFYSPVIDESGKPGGVIAVVVETTQRVLAERAQADATARQRRQFEQAPGFVIVMGGPEHVVEFVNHAHRRSFSSDNWVGKTIREAFPSLEGQGFFELLDGVYRTGIPYQFESEPVRYRRTPDAPEELRYLTFIYAPITDEAGAISGVFCEGFDVSETYKAQKALRDLNADLERKIVERTQARGRTWQVSPDLMGALNAQGYFETSNPAWQTMLGWSEEEVARMSIFELLHPDDVERTRAGFALTQIGQPAIRFPNRYRCKDGSYRWISWVGVPEDGMVYCSGRDITEDKQAEAELLAAQDALRQAQKMEAVGHLTGGIAHDFNNLLQGISGSIDRAQHRLAEGRIGDIDRFLKAAAESANRAGALTHRLLAFSRRQTLDPRPADVNRLIAGMEDLIRRTMGPEVTIEVVGAVGLWTVQVDGPQLENSLLNLCINARDAMPGGGKLTIETANKWMDERAARERELKPGQYVSLCVTDTGCGMEPAVIARAFDPFFTTKPLGQGTGLGLSMIYGFVRQSGGQVRVYSEVGKGTTMCLYFPRHLGPAEEQRMPEPNHLAHGAGETVLVVDDEPTVRMLIGEVLLEQSYNILEAADGPAALRILESGVPVDLLITDVGLPGGMNGRQVADAARQLRKDVKVLFITGYAENAAVGSGLLGDGMAILTKPFAMNALAEKVREMLEI
jgi:PAS domain S-box-containing protein